MEMLDVLKRLQEIAETKPELVKDAVDNVQRTNPQTERELTQGEEKSKEKFVKGMKKDKEGFEKRYGDDAKAVMYATATRMAKKEDETNERMVGGMSDIHIGAQDVVGEYVDDDGNLKMPKDQVLKALDMERKKAPFPRSYEIDMAMDMVRDDFDDGGARRPEIDEPYDMESELNTNTMENKEKEVVKEAIKISTDSPEEAGMMMQILKLAGIQPMGAEMPSMEPKQDMDHDHSDDDAMGSMDMAKMRNMVTAPDEEKAEETFANQPDEKEQDIDSLVNVHSGGLNKQKVQYRKEYPGDNPMAVEDTISEEDVANSLRAQYESFKKAYQEAAKPDYIDLDKDGNKTEPMKKAAQDKEAKDKK